MDIDVESGFCLEAVEGLGQFGHRLIGTGVGDPEGRHDQHRVLVNLFEHLLGIHAVLAR